MVLEGVPALSTVSIFAVCKHCHDYFLGNIGNVKNGSIRMKMTTPARNIEVLHCGVNEAKPNFLN